MSCCVVWLYHAHHKLKILYTTAPPHLLPEDIPYDLIQFGPAFPNMGGLILEFPSLELAMRISAALEESASSPKVFMLPTIHVGLLPLPLTHIHLDPYSLTHTHTHSLTHSHTCTCASYTLCYFTLDLSALTCKLVLKRWEGHNIVVMTI